MNYIPHEVLNPQFQPTWEDVERLALYEPTIHALVTHVRLAHLTREQALIAAMFKLVGQNQAWACAEFRRISRGAP